MSKPADYINVRLHILSPLHIGCDDVYEPTSFVIDEEVKKLKEFEPANFIKALSPEDRKRFCELCMSDNSLLQIFKFIRQKYSKVMGCREIDVTDGLISHYNKVLSRSSFDKKAVINNFLIQRTAYNPQNSLPYIPGSSIKGALRTGYLSMYAFSGGDIKELEKALSDPGYTPSTPVKGLKRAGELEKMLLQGSFATDPFSYVKVSDLLPPENVETRIRYAVNRKKRVSDRVSTAESGPAQIFETLNRGSFFEGRMIIKSPLRESGVLSPITKENLLLASNKHYARIYKKEGKVADQLGFAMPKLLTSSHGKLKERAFIIRLGRHSGAEAVTIEGNRKIKIMQGRGKPPIYDDHATTIWLASNKQKPENNNGLSPFGWAVLEVLP